METKPETTSPITRVHVYRDGQTWCYSAWSADGYDHCDTLPDAATRDEAESECSAMFPTASVHRAADVDTASDALLDLWRDAERAFEAATEDPDSERAARAAAAAESAMDQWAGALDAYEAGDLDTARRALEEAASIARDWGDDSREREALRLLDAAGGAR